MNKFPENHRRSLMPFRGEWTPRLYDRTVEILRTRRYGRRAEQAYIHSISRFIRFHGSSYDGHDTGRCKNCWGSRTSRRRWSARMGRTEAGRGCTAS